MTSAAANPDYKLVSHTVHASSLGGELVTLQTPDGEVLETGPAFGGLSDPFELALRSLVTIAVRTVEEATGADMTVFGRVGLRSIEHLADEAVASARWVDEFIEETDETFPAARFDRRRDRWAFVAIRESEYRRWQVLRLARARTEALRRAVRDLRAARKR